MVIETIQRRRNQDMNRGKGTNERRDGSLKPTPFKKPAFSSSSSSTPKRLKFHSVTCSSVASKAEVSEFAKLDPSDPVQKRRLEQRRKMVSYGKNTMGYDEYIKQVPKEKRQRRSMDTPSTPDYTLDIPNKRWAGQIRAWRRALHKYDPVDLQKSFASTIDNTDVTMEAGNPSVDMSIRDKELAEAKTKGLLVDFGDTCDKYENNSEVNKVSPVSIDGMDATSIEQDMRELDRWDKTRGNDDLLLSDDDDSDDDDLL